MKAIGKGWENMRPMHWMAPLVGWLLVACPILILSQDVFAAKQLVPLFPSASNALRQGIVRVVNRSDESGGVAIHAIDDSGCRVGPLAFTLDAKATYHINSDDLETGNPDKGLAGGVGSGQGDWRLEVESDLDIAVLTDVRNVDGFLMSLHDLVPEADGRQWEVTFYPGSNRAQQHRLRLINPGTEDAEVAIGGLNDASVASAGETRIVVPAGEARTVTAPQLESGRRDFAGRLGDGKRQLFVSASVPIQAMSLLESPTEHLTNLSTSPVAGTLAVVAAAGRDDLNCEATDVPVTIPDANLRAVIETTLEKAPGETISAAEMATLIELDALGSNIVDLTGLEYATNLARLNLQSNDISDLSPLSSLTGLEFLNLFENRISDLSPLSGLTGLEVIGLLRNRISDVSPLVALVELGDFLNGPENGPSININLDHNPLSEASVNELIAMLGDGLQVSFMAPGTSDQTPVNISDADLRATIRRTLDRILGLPRTNPEIAKNSTITVGELASLTTLYIGAPLLDVISDLNGLEQAANLTVITIQAGSRDSRLSKLSALLPQLADLPSLKYLNLSNNYTLTDLRGLSDLTGLRTLNLRNCDITDLSPLSGLTGLRHLVLKENNSLLDLSPLSGLTGLTALNLRHNDISDLSPLSGLSSLTFLDLRRNDIADLSPLSGLVGLTTLRLSYNNISDVSPLSGLMGLTSLDLYDNEIKNLTGLTGLTTLDLAGNDISDVSPLSGLTGLTTLDLAGNDISDVSPLSGLTGLTTLDLAGNDFSDLSPLSGLSSLKTLDLAYIPLLDLSTLSGLTGLTILDLNDNEIEDLSGLHLLAGLTSLDLNDNEIEDLSPLSDLTCLRTLDLSSNRISDLSPLSDLTGLRTLDLSDNGDLRNLSDLSGLAGLRILDLSDNFISDLSPLSGLTSLTTLDLSNNRLSDLSPLLENVGLRRSNSYIDLRGNWFLTAYDHSVAARIGATFSFPSLDRPVDISSDILRTAVEKALGKEQGEEISVADMGKLVRLEVWRDPSHTEFSYMSLIGLEFAEYLTYLSVRSWDFGSNQPLEPIQSLIFLTHLDLGRSAISDISPLSELTSLTYLDLAWGSPKFSELLRSGGGGRSFIRSLGGGFPRIQDISPLSRMTGLRHLNLSNNHILDLSPLSGLTGLTYLNLAANPNSDISALSELTSLTHLDLYWFVVSWVYADFFASEVEGRPKVSDLFPLSGLTGLHTLNLANNSISDLSPLSGLAGLTSLSLSYNAVSDVSPLSGLTGLHTLNLANNSISDLFPLSDLVGLTSLSLSGNAVSDVSSLSGLAGLHTLNLSSNSISDVSPLSGLVSLRSLDLENNAPAISDLAPLSALVGLESLSLYHNNISDLSALQHLTSLRELRLGANVLSDLSPLSGLTSLRYLDLHDNDISDISPLAENAANGGVGKGARIDLLNNPLNDASKSMVINLRALGINVDLAITTDDNSEFPNSAVTQIVNDNVVVMIEQEDPWDYPINTGYYAREFFRWFDDAFDYLFLVSDGKCRTASNGRSNYYGAVGVYWSVNNTTRGIGAPIFYDNRYGSDGKLKGIITSVPRINQINSIG